MLELFGELGGVFELCIVIFGFFFYPWATFSFHLKVLNKLYTVRTNQLSFFKKSKEINNEKLEINQ